MPGKFQVTFRGRKYDAKPFSGIKILPFAKAMGLIDESGDYLDFTNSDQESRDTMARAMIRSLSEPQNHHRVAYSLKQMVPGLPVEACNYEVITFENGSSSVKVTLDLEQNELFDLLGQLRADEKKAPEPKPEAVPAIVVEDDRTKALSWLSDQKQPEPAIANLSPGAIAALKESGVDLSPAGL